MYGDYLGYFEKHNLELLWLVFGHFLEKFGILFISTYSHIVGLHEYVPTCYLGILPN